MKGVLFTVKRRTRQLIGVFEWWYRDRFVVPKGRKRPPVPMGVSYDIGLPGDRVNCIGVCPHCGEVPHSYEECVFCGQRFTNEIQQPKSND